MSDTIGYVPIPSVGHELGVMFGFMALMLICAISYYFGWQMYQKKVIKTEEDRRMALRATPLYSGKYDEKGRGKTEYLEDAGVKAG